MKLIPISEHPDHVKILYELLAERTPEQSISHKKMPTWEEHLAFIAKKTDCAALDAYQDWCLIETDDDVVGAIYLTDHCEIGVSISREWQGYGYGSQAVELLMEKHGPRRYLANINPANEPSREMFEKLGFKLIQHTCALEVE